MRVGEQVCLPPLIKGTVDGEDGMYL